MEKVSLDFFSILASSRRLSFFFILFVFSTFDHLFSDAKMIMRLFGTRAHARRGTRTHTAHTQHTARSRKKIGANAFADHRWHSQMIGGNAFADDLQG